MSLLDKLKSLLGLGSSRSSTGEERDVGVTVERDTGAEPDARTERAVKEPVDQEPGGTDRSTGSGGSSEREPEREAGTTDDGEPSEEEPEDDPEEPRVPSEAVDVIKGIGPTYAGRLSDAGVETVDDLAAADADDLADRADVPAGRVENWIEKAQARSR